MADTKEHGWNGYNYTADEKAIIFAAYLENAGKKTAWLQELSELLNRSKPNICRFAAKHGLTDAKRTRVDPPEEKPCMICQKLHTNKLYCSSKCATIANAELRRGQNFWEMRDHPRGMLGKTHSPETREKMSKNLQKRWKDENDILNSEEHRQKISDRMSKQMVKKIKESPNSIYSRTQKGWAEFSGGKRYYLKSGWELRYANFLETLLKGKAIKSWTYEEDTFWFEAIKRGVRSYTPDFKVTYEDGAVEYHEVKGWMNKKSATKLKRMRIYYPDVKMVLIQEAEMKNI